MRCRELGESLPGLGFAGRAECGGAVVAVDGHPQPVVPLGALGAGGQPLQHLGLLRFDAPRAGRVRVAAEEPRLEGVQPLEQFFHVRPVGRGGYGRGR